MQLTRVIRAGRVRARRRVCQIRIRMTYTARAGGRIQARAGCFCEDAPLQVN